jgi:DNA-binding response OmpR family regulator
VARILLVDDDAGLREALSLGFADAGHEVIAAADGLTGLRLCESERPELIVSDVNMPGLDGFSLCKKLRQGGSRTPFILLTSRDSEIDEALGLELGADDFVTKPFSTRVLLLRVSVLLRREAERGAPEPSALLREGKLELDSDRLQVSYGGVALQVTVTEFRLLDALARRPGLVLSRHRLLELARDDDSVVADRIIDTYVRRLRAKLCAIDPRFEGIETVIGAGYRWRTTR